MRIDVGKYFTWKPIKVTFKAQFEYEYYIYWLWFQYWKKREL